MRLINFRIAADPRGTAAWTWRWLRHHQGLWLRVRGRGAAQLIEIVGAGSAGARRLGGGGLLGELEYELRASHDHHLRRRHQRDPARADRAVRPGHAAPGALKRSPASMSAVRPASTPASASSASPSCRARSRRPSSTVAARSSGKAFRASSSGFTMADLLEQRTREHLCRASCCLQLWRAAAGAYAAGQRLRPTSVAHALRRPGRAARRRGGAGDGEPARVLLRLVRPEPSWARWWPS
jgi:hypothetical protein